MPTGENRKRSEDLWVLEVIINIPTRTISYFSNCKICTLIIDLLSLKYI